jgi:ABC-type transport system substrate-binding protein
MEEVQRNTNWRHDSYEKLVEQARRMQDQKMRMRLYQDVERILIGEAVIIPLFYHWYPLLVKPWVENFKISPVLDWFWKDVIVKPH